MSKRQYNLPSNYLKILRLIAKFPVVNLPYLTLLYATSEGASRSELSSNKKLRHRFYMRVRRAVNYLSQKGLIYTSKIDGIVNIYPTPSCIDLIKRREAKFKLRYLRHINPYRREAMLFLSKKHRLDSDSWDELATLFECYFDDTKSKRLVFKHVEDDHLLILPYNHRFTKRRLKRLLKQYNKIWDIAANLTNKGVFATFTLDPKRYSNLMEASRIIGKAFNRFLSYFQRKYGFRPTYIAILEPMDSGNPHLHCVFFGLDYLEEHRQLTKILQRIGFGEIHFEYKIKWDGNNWVWARKKPKGSYSGGVRGYLSKYLKKTFTAILSNSSYDLGLKLDDVSSCKIAFYWATGKRIFTYSRLFAERKPLRLFRIVQYIFLGSYYVEYLLNPNFLMLLKRKENLEDDEGSFWRKPIGAII